MRKILKKYLIWGYYGFGNLGDDLMLKVITNKILNNYPDARVYVRCYNVPPEKNIIPLFIEKSNLPLPFRTIAYISKVMRSILRVDSFVIGGGTLFLDKGRHNRSMLLLAIAVFFARLLKKKIYIIGIGIDMLTHPLNIIYLKYILMSNHYICLRDDFSYAMAKYLIRQENVFRGSDIIFEESFVAALTENSPFEKKHIVISLSDYYKTWYSNDKREVFIKRSYNLIKMLLEKYANRYTILLCAFQKTLGERDYELLSDIRNSIIEKNKEYPEKIKLEYITTEEQIRKIFGSAVFTIGMRYHALVLSAIFKKPFLGIDIEMKIKEFCVEFNMPFINIDAFLAENINPSDIENLLSREISDKKITQQMNLSKANFEWLNNLK